METFLVRLFVAPDLEGFEGTVERPGHPSVGFHDEAELVRRLLEIAGRLEPGLGRVGEGKAATVGRPPVAERLADVDGPERRLGDATRRPATR